MIVIDEVWIPLVGLATEESVESLEATPERPVALACRQVLFLERRHVPLAESEGLPTTLDQDLRNQGRLEGNAATQAWKAVREFLDHRHANGCGVAPGDQSGAAGRAQRGSVELSEAKSFIGDSLQVRHLDQTAVDVPRAEAGVIPNDEEHVRGVLRRLRLSIRLPIRS